MAWPLLAEKVYLCKLSLKEYDEWKRKLLWITLKIGNNFGKRISVIAEYKLMIGLNLKYSAKSKKMQIDLKDPGTKRGNLSDIAPSGKEG